MIMLSGGTDKSGVKWVNTTLPHLAPKIAGEATEQDMLHSEFMKSYVVSMNQAAQSIMSEQFDTEEHAYNAFTHMLRSYIPGWTLHIGSRRTTNGVYTVVYTCHTVTHKKHANGTQRVCEWTATLTQTMESKFVYSQVTPFQRHQPECLLAYGRFTTHEVCCWRNFTSIGRASLAQQLNCPPVDEATYRKQASRAASKICGVAAAIEQGQLEGVVPDLSLIHI